MIRQQIHLSKAVRQSKKGDLLICQVVEKGSPSPESVIM